MDSIEFTIWNVDNSARLLPLVKLMSSMNEQIFKLVCESGNW